MLINNEAQQILSMIKCCQDEMDILVMDSFIDSFKKVYQSDPTLELYTNVLVRDLQVRRVDIIIYDMLSPNESNAA